MGRCTILGIQTNKNNDNNACTSLTTAIERKTDVSNSRYVKSRIFEGIIPHPKKDSNHKKKNLIKVWNDHFGTVDGDMTLFSNNCKSSEVIFYSSAVKKGFQCLNCEQVRYWDTHRLQYIMTRRASIFKKGVELILC